MVEVIPFDDRKKVWPIWMERNGILFSTWKIKGVAWDRVKFHAPYTASSVFEAKFHLLCLIREGYLVILVRGRFVVVGLLILSFFDW